MNRYLRRFYRLVTSIDEKLEVDGDQKLRTGPKIQGDGGREMRHRRLDKMETGIRQMGQ